MKEANSPLGDAVGQFQSGAGLVVASDGGKKDDAVVLLQLSERDAADTDGVGVLLSLDELGRGGSKGSAEAESDGSERGLHFDRLVEIWC